MSPDPWAVREINVVNPRDIGSGTMYLQDVGVNMNVNVCARVISQCCTYVAAARVVGRSSG